MHILQKHLQDLTVYRCPQSASLDKCLPSASRSNDRDADSFYSITLTPTELSIVQPTSWDVAFEVEKSESGWFAFEVIPPNGEESIDFSTIGVMAELSKVMKDAGISLFVISTFNTDWILIKKGDATEAESAFSAAGHKIL